METKPVYEVYKAIAAVTRALGREGIGKDRKNLQQNYSFRGIDDIYNALSGHLADAHLCIIPRVIEREAIERQNKSGGALFYVTVKAEYDVVSAIDGSTHTAVAYGEAMDSGDKATSKAMSAAYKYMAMQLFCIPTEGDNDAEAITHEVAPAQAPIDAAGAERLFFDRYSATLGGSDWPAVQQYLKSRAPKPSSVEGWRAAAEAVRDKAKGAASEQN